MHKNLPFAQSHLWNSQKIVTKHPLLNPPPSVAKKKTTRVNFQLSLLFLCSASFLVCLLVCFFLFFFAVWGNSAPFCACSDTCCHMCPFLGSWEKINQKTDKKGNHAVTVSTPTVFETFRFKVGGKGVPTTEGYRSTHTHTPPQNTS